MANEDNAKAYDAAAQLFTQAWTSQSATALKVSDQLVSIDVYVRRTPHTHLTPSRAPPILDPHACTARHGRCAEAQNFDVGKIAMGKLFKRIRLGDRDKNLDKKGRSSNGFSDTQTFTCARRPRCAPCGVGVPAVTRPRTHRRHLQGRLRALWRLPRAPPPRARHPGQGADEAGWAQPRRRCDHAASAGLRLLASWAPRPAARQAVHSSIDNLLSELDTFEQRFKVAVETKQKQAHGAVLMDT